jgi:hypothetical protein
MDLNSRFVNLNLVNFINKKFLNTFIAFKYLRPNYSLIQKLKYPNIFVNTSTIIHIKS